MIHMIEKDGLYIYIYILPVTHTHLSLSIYIYIYIIGIYIYIYIYIYITCNTHIHTHLYIYIYIYINCCRQIHLPRKQRLINRKGHQHVVNEGMDSYQLAIDHMEIRPNRWNKKQFLPGGGRIDTAIWMHYMDANETDGEKARRHLHKNAASNLEQV